MNMKGTYKSLLSITLLVSLCFALQTAHAGNKDRSGQAAAQHLLISPWGASNGWGNVGVAATKGIESSFTNIAGMAFTRKTEIGYTHTLYCYGSGTNINALGIVQSLGQDRGNVGISAMIMTVGDIVKTSVDNPEGGLGTFSPMLMNLGVSYAKSFSEAIHAGINFKIISETTSDISAMGFAIDAGIQYVTGKQDQFQIGIALKNIGLPMSYKGDGLDFRGYAEGSNLLQTFANRSQSYEMPALLSLGLSYDFLFGNKSKVAADGAATTKEKINRENSNHRITLAGSFISNAYSKDQFILGMEYCLMNIFQIRGGYTIEDFKSNSTSVFSGPSCGTSIFIPLGKKVKSRIAIDYAYRFTHQWKGCHSIGARIIL